MTIFGIAGCTALVICGMGIRDTSVALSPKQYGHVTRYDLLAVANPDDFHRRARHWMGAARPMIPT